MTRSPFAFYKLVGRIAVPCRMVEALSDDTGYRVGDDMVGPLQVSTVFLAVDYGFGDGPPLLFETMIFDTSLPENDGRWDEMYQTRCSSWDEAERMHVAAIAVAAGWLAMANADAQKGLKP